MTEKIAVLTGGGDCPGLNAVIRAVVRSAHAKGMDVIGVRDGFKGAVEGDFFQLELKDISGLLPRGGTILGTTNRDNPFSYFVDENGKRIQKDCSDQVIKNFSEWGISTLIAIGGEGSLIIASQLTEKGLRVIGVPKTIDNDLMATDMTFGFQTAVETAQYALDKLHTTAESHHRVMILEVMGRYAGWIALYAGIAGGADIILLPEIPYNLEKVVQAIKDRINNNKKFSIIVAAEGARSLTGEMIIERRLKDRTDPIKLGGIGAKVARDLESLIDLEARVTVLGHLQRGGSPNAYDRILATSYGTAAVQAVHDKAYNTMVALQGSKIVAVPLKDALKELKRVEMDNQILLAARQIGIKFGD